MASAPGSGGAPWRQNFVVAVCSSVGGGAAAIFSGGGSGAGAAAAAAAPTLDDAQWRSCDAVAVRLPAGQFLPSGGTPHGGSVEHALPSLRDVYYNNALFSTKRRIAVPGLTEELNVRPPSQRFLKPLEYVETGRGASPANRACVLSQLSLAHYRGVGPLGSPARFAELSRPLTPSLLWELAVSQSGLWSPASEALLQQRPAGIADAPLPALPDKYPTGPYDEAKIVWNGVRAQRAAAAAAAACSTVAVIFQVFRRRDQFLREHDAAKDPPLGPDGRKRQLVYVRDFGGHAFDADGDREPDAATLSDMLYPVGMLAAHADADDPRGAHVRTLCANSSAKYAGVALLHTVMTLVLDGRVALGAPPHPLPLLRTVVSVLSPLSLVTYFWQLGLRPRLGCEDDGDDGDEEDDAPYALPPALAAAYVDGTLPRWSDFDRGTPTVLAAYAQQLRRHGLLASGGVPMRLCIDDGDADEIPRVPYDPPKRVAAADDADLDTVPGRVAQSRDDGKPVGKPFKSAARPPTAAVKSAAAAASAAPKRPRAAAARPAPSAAAAEAWAPTAASARALRRAAAFNGDGDDGDGGSDEGGAGRRERDDDGRAVRAAARAAARAEQRKLERGAQTAVPLAVRVARTERLEEDNWQHYVDVDAAVRAEDEAKAAVIAALQEQRKMRARLLALAKRG